MTLWLQQMLYSLICSNIHSYTKLKLQRPILDVVEYRYTYIRICMYVVKMKPKAQVLSCHYHVSLVCTC